MGEPGKQSHVNYVTNNECGRLNCVQTKGEHRSLKGTPTKDKLSFVCSLSQVVIVLE